MIVSYYIIYANHFDRPGIKAIFLFLPVSVLNSIVHD